MQDLNTAQVEQVTLNFPKRDSEWPYQALGPAYAAGIAYTDDRYVPVADARISLLDWGFTRSDACQDTISVYDGQFFRLEDHLERFERSWKSLRLENPLSRDEVRDVVRKLVAMGGWRDAYIQIIMTRGTPPVGSRDPRLCKNRFHAFAIPYVWIANPEAQQRGLKVHVSDICRVPAQSVSPLIKHYHWLDFEMGLFEALDHGQDTVLLKNIEGYVAEGPGFNVFAVSDGHLLTPRSSALDGMTRRTVLEIAKEVGIEAAEVDLSVAALQDADEAFLTTTAGGLLPIATVNGATLGSAPGSVTGRLHGEYWGRRASGWLSSPALYW
ncbi:aminotransferase class IV [Caballeronia sp. J97]|uniref:aminotransferase class IV n=1 Tax=Caballeronia sp. J97 TaxID=2805429 RepID=UPI002AB11EB5|nr:aminotransferase class IV [Caballeronia sp. J97]